jgi:hypothetical protein
MNRSNLYLILALLAGLGLGLLYSWGISPVKYVDASPAILRTDFKDQYRVLIAAAYASTHNLPRAQARLELLGDADPVGELSAQAQRMLASGESFDKVRPLAQLATDLGQGYASIPLAATSTQVENAQVIETQSIETSEVETATDTVPGQQDEPTPITAPTFDSTPLAPQTDITPTPRPTFTPVPPPGKPFALVGQDTVCNPKYPNGLLQLMLLNSRDIPVPGIKIAVTWDQGEDYFFTGLKPDISNGYADFIMQADTAYSVQVVDGGAFVTNITAPTCTDENGATYLGGLLLTFQQ